MSDSPCIPLHLFTTDVSAFDGLPLLPAHCRVNAVIVPKVRLGSEKVDRVRQRALELGLPVVVHPARGARLPEDLPRAEAALSWMYAQIIAPADLDRYPRGLLNMHGGRLPDYRGSNVLQWAIINGEPELGITWHEIVEEVDAGGIYAESAIPIPETATALDMRQAMIEEGLRLLPQALERFLGGAQPLRRPDPQKGRVWPRRRSQDGVLAPDMTARQVRDMVRALCPPWPAAILYVGHSAHPIREVADGPGPDTLALLTADGTTLHLRPLAPVAPSPS